MKNFHFHKNELEQLIHATGTLLRNAGPYLSEKELRGLKKRNQQYKSFLRLFTEIHKQALN